MLSSILSTPSDPEFLDRPVWRLSSVLRVQRLISIVGLVLMLAVTAIGGSLWLDQRSSNSTRLGAFAFVLAMVAPFVVAWIAAFGPNRHVLRAFTFAAAVGAGVLALLGMFSFGILIAPLAIILFWCVHASRPEANDPTPASAYLVTMVVMTGLVLAIGALFFRDTAACWSSANPGWHAVPSMSSQTSISNGGSVTCTSNYRDNTEGLLSLGFLTLAAVGVVLGRAFVRPETPTTPAP